jgi:hypothetical protein
MQACTPGRAASSPGTKKNSPEWRCTKRLSLGGVGGRSSLAVPESLGGVGGGRPCDCSRDLGCDCRGRTPFSLVCSGSEYAWGSLLRLSLLRLLRPPTLEDSPASSTTGSVVPISPRSAEGLRTTLIAMFGTSCSLTPCFLERSSWCSAFSMTLSVDRRVMLGTATSLATFKASSFFSRSAASLVLVTPLINLTNRSP